MGQMASIMQTLTTVKLSHESHPHLPGQTTIQELTHAPPGSLLDNRSPQRSGHIVKGIPGDTSQGKREPKELTIRGDGSTAVEGWSVLSLGGKEHGWEGRFVRPTPPNTYNSRLTTKQAILSSPPYHASAGVWPTATTLREATANSMPDLYVPRARMEEDAGYEADVGVRAKAGVSDEVNVGYEKGIGMKRTRRSLPWSHDPSPSTTALHHLPTHFLPVSSAVTSVPDIRNTTTPNSASSPQLLYDRYHPAPNLTPASLLDGDREIEREESLPFYDKMSCRGRPSMRRT
ncbi:hypothetical protein BDQ17DRAFT_1479093 [Cyathus striatus]|nr:hypothetical protein BDQ17DRAFT_1479093 [Cyathus striatus]